VKNLQKLIHEVQKKTKQHRKKQEVYQENYQENRIMLPCRFSYFKHFHRSFSGET